MIMPRKNLAAKIALAIALSTGPMLPAVHAGGIPVIDVTNVIQTTVSATESVTQTLKMIQQYQTQLQQYQDMLKNSLEPSTYLWDNASATMNNLRTLVDSLSYYKNTMGSVDAYLRQFGDLNYYRTSPCFNPSGFCSGQERFALDQARLLGYQSQKRANNAVFRGLDVQHDALQSDAGRLEQLQTAAGNAEGRMELSATQINSPASKQINFYRFVRCLLLNRMRQPHGCRHRWRKRQGGRQPAEDCDPVLIHCTQAQLKTGVQAISIEEIACAQ